MARPRGPLVRWLTRHVAYPLEGLALHLAVAVFASLPVDRASALGGWIGRTFGPRLPGHRTALMNLARAFPEKTDAQRRSIAVRMWDNLGRTMAEYPHIAEIAANRVELVGFENVVEMRDDGLPATLATAHLANWEVPARLARDHGLPLAVVFREPNNPYAARILSRLRAAAAGQQIPKGPKGAAELRRAFQAKSHVAILIDQKLNDGIAVPFFGRPAMTVAAPAVFARRMGVPVYPARPERLGGARFRVTVLPRLDCPHTEDRDHDALVMMTRLNEILEQWIRERPEQWMWNHRRWPS